MEIRLQKWLSDAGAASRRKAEVMIAEGRVAVNGRTVTEQGVKIDPACDSVTLDGLPVEPATRLVYLMLHKPEGFVTTVTDPQGRPVVMDLIPEVRERVFPVGRLDYDTSGLLLLTNDGTLAQALTHPSRAVPKVYAARLKGKPSPAEVRAFTSGLMIDGRRTAPSGLRVTRVTNSGTPAEQAQVTITLHEGRNRQIRKMCEAIGHPVLSLKRVSVGPVKLSSLPRGAWRYLTQAEITGLYKV